MESEGGATMTLGMTPESQWSPALSPPLAVCLLFSPLGCLGINLEPKRAARARSFKKKVFLVFVFVFFKVSTIFFLIVKRLSSNLTLLFESLMPREGN